MHKHRSKNAQRRSKKQKIGPTPLAGKLWIIGLIILLLGLCDVTARFCDGLRRGDVGILLLLAGLMGLGIACAVVFAALSHLTRKAAELQGENDLTI